MIARLTRLTRRAREHLTASGPAPAWQRSYAGPACFALFTAGVLTAGYHMTMSYRLPDYQRLAELAADAQRRQTELREQAAELTARVASLETEVAVVRGANRQLMLSEDHRQEDLANLRAEVDFYQRLAEAGGKQSGLAIHSVEILPGFSSRRWRFSVAIIQRLQRAEPTSGTLRLQLEGLHDGQPSTLDWGNLKVSGEPDRLRYSFKYFAQVKGRLLLPADFSPRQLTIILVPDGDDIDGIRRSFPWQEIARAGGNVAETPSS